MRSSIRALRQGLSRPTWASLQVLLIALSVCVLLCALWIRDDCEKLALRYPEIFTRAFWVFLAAPVVPIASAIAGVVAFAMRRCLPVWVTVIWVVTIGLSGLGFANVLFIEMLRGL
jgi:hypothetical protein